MKNKLLAFAGALVSLAVAGSFCTPSLIAQVRPALVQDADQAARDPFTFTTVEITESKSVLVPIPSGYRLVVEYVSISGFVRASQGSSTAPRINLRQFVVGQSPGGIFFFDLEQTNMPEFYRHNEKVAIYADRLSIDATDPADERLTTSFFTVTLSGHLVKIP